MPGWGGDEKYSNTVASITGYKAFFGEDLVLSAELAGGMFHSLKEDSSISDRFFLGGDSFRGFQSFGIGPRDHLGNPLGGKYYAISRLELSFPLGLPEELGVVGAVFMDAGSLWGLDTVAIKNDTLCDDDKDRNTENICRARSTDFDLRSSVGLGIYWNTAIGPLVFNFSKPLEYVKGLDRTESFRLTVGTRF